MMRFQWGHISFFSLFFLGVLAVQAQNLAPLPEDPSVQEGDKKSAFESILKEGVLQMFRDLLETAPPEMKGFADILGNLDQYEPPEILPNGDILIRRKLDVGPNIPPDMPQDTPHSPIPQERATDL